MLTYGGIHTLFHSTPISRISPGLPRYTYQPRLSFSPEAPSPSNQHPEDAGAICGDRDARRSGINSATEHMVVDALIFSPGPASNNLSRTFAPDHLVF